MQIREATAADWPAIWPFFHDIVAAGETFTAAGHRRGGGPRGVAADAARPHGRRRRRHRTVLGTAEDEPQPPAEAPRTSPAPSFMVDPRRRPRRRPGPGRIRPDVGARRGLPGDAVQRRRRDQHRAVALWRSLGFQVMTTSPRASGTPPGLRGAAHHVARALARPRGSWT